MADEEFTRPPAVAETAPRPPRWRLLRNGLRRIGLMRDNESSVRETLGELIEETVAAAEAEIEPQERALFANILKLHGLTAEDVMVPRADIGAVEHRLTLEELFQAMSKYPHSRMPVYRERLDEVIGMIHIKDVLAWWGREADFQIVKILRPVLFIAPSMHVLDLLLQMRATRHHLALVVDEYGGIDGLVTIENVVEEIVGEIEDEHDLDPRPRLEPGPGGTLVADARLPIEALEEQTGPVLLDGERDDIDTLAGLVFALAGRIPARGEVIRHPSGLEFEVMEADPRRIKRLRIRNLPRRQVAAS
jgi:CBS domain containing-hemolysin-like protein